MDEQRKKDEEAAKAAIFEGHCCLTGDCPHMVQEECLEYVFKQGLTHCRDTEVKELRVLCDKMSLNSLKIEIERDEFREQLRVAVEALEKHECHPTVNCYICAALEKIKAIKLDR